MIVHGFSVGVQILDVYSSASTLGGAAVSLSFPASFCPRPDLSHEKAISELDTTQMLERLERCYKELGDSGEHATNCVRVLVRYQIVLGFKAGLNRDQTVRVCSCWSYDRTHCVACRPDV